MKACIVGAICAISATAQPYTISTISGVDRGADGISATSIDFKPISSVALDRLGNLYFAELVDNRVRRMSPDGTLTTVAGGSPSGDPGSENVQATTIPFPHPFGISVDDALNIYICEPDLGRLRKVSPIGVMTTIAGGSQSPSNDDGIPATSAFINCFQTAVDPAGNVYLGDAYRVRRIGLDGIITTVAGTYKYDGATVLSGPATTVNISVPTQLALDPAGNLYFADEGFGLVRMVTPDGFLTTVAGARNASLSPPLGIVPATSVGLMPEAIATDGAYLYIISHPTGNVYLYRVSLAGGTIELMCGGPEGNSGDGGPVALARFTAPNGTLAAKPGILYVGDGGIGRIRAIQNGTISTIVGRDFPDNEPALGAPLLAPSAMAADSFGNLWFFAEGLYVQHISPDGLIHTREQVLRDSIAVATDPANNVYISTYEGRIFKLPPGGEPILIGGTGQPGHSGDGGPALEATFDLPFTLAANAKGDVYVGETGVHASGAQNIDIRLINGSTGIVTTIAGDNTGHYLGDTSSPLSAGVFACALAVDTAQNLYIADGNNNRILVLTPDGHLTTVAGSANPDSGDGGPAILAGLSEPCSIALDSNHNIYLGEFLSHRVRRIGPDGIIQTIAGNGTSYPSAGDGGPATSAQFFPSALAAGPFGVVYIADVENERIRKLEPMGAPDVITITSSAPGSGPVDQPLPTPITVQVIDATGHAVAGIPVSFAVSPQASATFNPASANTASDGTASTVVTLGDTPGTIQISANVSTLVPATLSLLITNGPAITQAGVVGAALGSAPVKALSPNGLVSIFGRDLAPFGTSQQVGSGQLINGKLPFTLDGVCVRVNSSYASMLYVSPTQLNVQVPSNLPTGNAIVQVVQNCTTSGEIPSNTLSVPAQVAAPEFFYLSHGTNGANPVAAFHATDGTAVTAASPAHAGEILSIFGTGFGLSNPEAPAGTIPTQAAPLANPSSVKIGSVTLKVADLLYAGVASFAGVYQLNVRVPSGISSGDQPIFVAVGNISSPAGAVLAVAAP